MLFGARGVALLGGLMLVSGCCLEVTNGAERASSAGGASTGGTSAGVTSGGGTSGGSSSGASSTGGTTGVVICFKDELPLLHRPSAVGCDGGQEGDTNDACFDDLDCLTADAGNRICSCAPASTQPSPGPFGTANTCLPGSCSIDSDCPCGYCSPTLDDNCPNLWGVVGYYCHSEIDACVNDSDCPDAGFCVFGADAGRWTCTDNLCYTGMSPPSPSLPGG